MKVLVKTAPSQNYRKEYDDPDNIEGIIHALPSTYDAYDISTIGIALKLGAGERVEFTNPFGSKVYFQMEDKP